MGFNILMVLNLNFNDKLKARLQHKLNLQLWWNNILDISKNLIDYRYNWT